MLIADYKIAVIGLGYIGLPLFCMLSRLYKCVGIDTDKHRVKQLQEGEDYKCCDKRRNILWALRSSKISSDYTDAKDCNIFIVCLPTDVDKSKHPALKPLTEACKSIGAILKKGDIVIFESTVYPGATEEVCNPVLEQFSGLTLDVDYSLGYSPERINVGDKSHHIYNTPKIVAASNEPALEIVSNIYSSVIDAEIVKASSIKVAEAAKMYENVQRDVLIALANEYADYCRAEGVSINEVTRCASTKWNFSNVNPGMVGGHCIGVDPYYLLHRASLLNADIPLIQEARTINEGILQKVFERVRNEINSLNKSSKEISILLMGLSYKPNTPDIRNSKALELTKLLIGDFLDVTVFDPLVNSYQVKKHHKIDVVKSAEELRAEYDVVIRLVNHKHFAKIEITAIKCLSVEDLL